MHSQSRTTCIRFLKLAGFTAFFPNVGVYNRFRRQILQQEHTS